MRNRRGSQARVRDDLIAAVGFRGMICVFRTGRRVPRRDSPRLRVMDVATHGRLAFSVGRSRFQTQVVPATDGVVLRAVPDGRDECD